MIQLQPLRFNLHVYSNLVISMNQPNHRMNPFDRSPFDTLLKQFRH